MKISKLSQNIADSPTLALDAVAKSLIAQGKPVIHLGGGEPHSLTPPAAVEEGIKKLKSGKVKYTKAAGTPELKQAVVNHTKRIYGKEVNPENILISNGAKQAIFNFLLAAVNPQDEVIFPAPYWVSYPEMVKLCGAVPVAVYPPENSFEPLFEDIQKKVTDKTKAIFVNTPNNPSGAVYSNKFIKQIVEFCEQKNIYLVMDDIYRQLVFDGVKPANCFDYAKNSDNIVVINGVSKAYGMTGFRIGWAVGNEKLIKAMTKMQVQTVSCPSDLSQSCTKAALESGEECVNALVKTLEENRRVLLEGLSKIKKVKIIEPQGTFYALVDFREYEKSSDKLAKFLIDKAMVVTIPGSGFGLEGFLRISFCSTKENIAEGVERIRQILDEEEKNYE